jgi:hypothetical protein
MAARLEAYFEKRRPVANITEDELPTSAGVYVWYRNSEPIFIGTTGNLQKRVFFEHIARAGAPMSSALRRVAASTLGYGTPSDLRSGRRLLTAAEATAVEAWLREGSVSWHSFSEETEALKAAAELRNQLDHL